MRVLVLIYGNQLAVLNDEDSTNYVHKRTYGIGLHTVFTEQSYEDTLAHLIALLKEGKVRVNATYMPNGSTMISKWCE